MYLSDFIGAFDTVHLVALPSNRLFGTKLYGVGESHVLIVACQERELCLSYLHKSLTRDFSYGQPGVQCTVTHDKKVAVQKLLFLINEVSDIFVYSNQTV